MVVAVAVIVLAVAFVEIVGAEQPDSAATFAAASPTRASDPYPDSGPEIVSNLRLDSDQPAVVIAQQLQPLLGSSMPDPAFAAPGEREAS